LLQELRRRTPALKAIAMTGYVNETQLQEMQTTTEWDLVLRKPFDIQVLAESTHRLLNR
jgi:CheY-like chemotaxis protein